MRWLKYILISLFVLVLTLGLINLFKKGFPTHKGDLNKQTYSNQQTKNLDVGTKATLSDTADGLEAAMKGWGTWDTDWLRLMKSINSDAEFLYMESAFGTRDGLNLRAYIGSESDLKNGGEIPEVNANYSEKGMKTRL